MIQLNDTVEECCGCSACMDICPQNAITMKEDKWGYIYPHIDEHICTNCGACINICAYKKSNTGKESFIGYAAVSADEEILLHSASGGIFYSIAYEFVKNGGIVYGCMMDKNNNGFETKHCRVTNVEELVYLQGSKYVQSRMDGIYQLILNDLKNGKRVLFSGTPCQIAQVNQYIGNRWKDELFTIDMICHGVPNERILNSYISFLERKRKKKIKKIVFRDKAFGWNLCGSILYEGVEKKEMLHSIMSSYYSLFLGGFIYRENCYSCKYACVKRVGDITIGDYWGVQQDGIADKIDIKKGISCVLINTDKGDYCFDKYGEKILKFPTKIENIVGGNKQLQSPSLKNEEKEHILDMLFNEGYEKVDAWYMKSLGSKRFLYKIWFHCPERIKKGIKNIRNFYISFFDA